MQPVTGELLLSLTNKSAFRMVHTSPTVTIIQFVGCGGHAFCGLYLGVRSVTGRQLRDVRRILQDTELRPVSLASAIGWDVSDTGSGITYRSTSNCGVVCGLYMAPIGSSNVGLSPSPAVWETSQAQNGTSANGLGAGIIVTIVIVSVLAACALVALLYVLCHTPTQTLPLNPAASASFEEGTSASFEAESSSEKGERSLVIVPTLDKMR